jgi:hypothetical protein
MVPIDEGGNSEEYEGRRIFVLVEALLVLTVLAFVAVRS